MNITQRSVEAAKPPASGYIILFDDKLDGFGVRVTAAGTKSFVLNYRVANGDKRRHTIGKWPKWTADAARDEAANVLLPAINKKGADPVRDKKALREEPTLADLAKEYVEQHAEMKKRDKSIYEDNRMLNNIILPKMGTLRISAVSRRDVQKMHNSLRKTPYQANRVLALLSKMFTFAMEGEMRPDNPAKGVERFREDKREAWLTVDQLHALSDALDSYAEQDAADALRLLIVTGARPDEVIGATWPMFDLDRSIWTKPSHHVKEKKIEHTPLNTGALVILRRMAEHRTGIHLFPGRESTDPDKPRGARTTLRNAWKQVCKAAGLATEYSVKGKRGKPLPRWKPNVRVYDLRHTFASHLVSRNWSLPLVGKLLGQVRPETTARYAHVSDGAQREVANDYNNVIEMKTLPEKTA
jgi:integrase